MQTWRFRKESLIRIGRSEQNEVVIGDPYASRFHCELRFEDEHWNLINVGRHGTMVRGERIETMAIHDGTVFQLGPTGASFRFETVHEIPASETTSMYSGLPAFGEALKLDEAQMEAQVGQIVETPHFQQLKKFSEDLRRPTKSPNESETKIED